MYPLTRFDGATAKHSIRGIISGTHATFVTRVGHWVAGGLAVTHHPTTSPVFVHLRGAVTVGAPNARETSSSVGSGIATDPATRTDRKRTNRFHPVSRQIAHGTQAARHGSYYRQALPTRPVVLDGLRVFRSRDFTTHAHWHSPYG